VTTKTSPLEKETKRTSEPTIISQALSSINPSVYPPWRGGRSTSLDDPRWKIRRERQKRDPFSEGKMPIEFYGKVVDEKSQPVADATVKFTWTDLSPEGSSKRETKSDATGLFALHGVRGKNLGASAEKKGYDIVRSKNRYGFDYAAFWDEQYYEADPNNPVLFHLRKKGEAAPMVRWEKEIKIAIGTPATVQIDPQTKMQFELLANEVLNYKSRWEARITMLGGKLTPATEEFAYEAPAIGYAPSMVIDSKTPKSPTWAWGEGGSYYIKAGPIYGCMDIQMETGNDWFRVIVWLNPSGSRNLEPDPALLFRDMDAYNCYMAKQKQPAK